MPFPSQQPTVRSWEEKLLPATLQMGSGWHSRAQTRPRRSVTVGHTSRKEAMLDGGASQLCPVLQF